MSNPNLNISLVRRENRRQTIFAALDLIRGDVTATLAEQILLKPNFLSGSNQLASTHPDAIRGILDFLQTVPNPPQKVIIAEGGNEDYAGQAFRTFGYYALADEYGFPIQLIDLNRETAWQETKITLTDNHETVVRMPKIVLDAPCTFSVAIPKTHDVCVVTLALKNMIMGTLYKLDRIKMHGFGSHAERQLPAEAQILNLNLARVARYLKPDIAVIDGTVGLQGNGPGGTDAVDWGIAVAGTDVIAADTVMTKAMGFEPAEMGLLHYAEQLGLGVTDLNRINIVGGSIKGVQRAFTPHEKTPLQLQWQVPQAAW